MPVPEQTRGARSPLEHFNHARAEDAVHTLLACLRHGGWAHRLAAHRPYPDLPALLAAADEATYDLTPEALTAALAAEPLPALPAGAYSAAHTALGAANAAYESRFGHTFVICVDDLAAHEVLDHVLEGIRSRLANDPEEERLVAADELRRLAKGRLRTRLGGTGR
ncbi:OHCU decarboxylase [Streptomyces leeuwenhoekii]|uniref:2-oxo-4-hydroxy-4-carboxy-5-ureidoimidazoline decarboxylase n=1 Tax=Streptomyces leeuwenhoekii TaxID=1437453 RepID=A0ABR5I080_STRLW|nr:2-oxo-4-hydroxy-4-carboxy-5-ureidoimidazoline decarboxylase [Streptomyces leeuwenhoekii]KMS79687.1 OHCU decarboxylase [Streptomyces leeuwenhoekii]